MEKKVEEIKREIVDQRVYYVAIDGTEFNNEEEGRKYENSAAGVLMAKVKGFAIVKEVSSDMLDDCGDSDIYYMTVKPACVGDIDALNQLWFLFGGNGLEKAIFSDKDLNNPIIVGYRMCNCEIEWCWFHKVADFIRDVTNGEYKLI